jgi:hypothetical protein
MLSQPCILLLGSSHPKALLLSGPLPLQFELASTAIMQMSDCHIYMHKLASISAQTYVNICVHHFRTITHKRIVCSRSSHHSLISHHHILSATSLLEALPASWNYSWTHYSYKPCPLLGTILPSHARWRRHYSWRPCPLLRTTLGGLGGKEPVQMYVK